MYVGEFPDPALHLSHAFTSHGISDESPSHESYTVAWICALYIELAAAVAMLDEVHHHNLPRFDNDNNSYTLGSIGGHNIVIACLPEGAYGNINAANVVTNLIRTFPSVRQGLMVGIGGGAPNNKADIRLGDVVVATRVMQYDLGKIMEGGEIMRTAIPKTPHHSLCTAITTLRATHESRPSRIPDILRRKMVNHPEYRRPNAPDHLYEATYQHQTPGTSCHSCDWSRLQQRKSRVSEDSVIHYGGTGSSNQVMRDALTRDAIAKELDLLCFEMEAAGLMDILPCLPIRGICDYSDSHKLKDWQNYAAAVAAAYAREFLESLAPHVDKLSSLRKTIVSGQAPSAQRRQRMLRSLKFENIDVRRDTIKAAFRKTCSWFLKHPGFLQWIDPGQKLFHHGFLWIRGKPGAGKSTMMKFLYKESRSKDIPSQALTSSFFFHARGEDLEKSVTGLYRSLLWQLLSGFTDLQQVFDDSDLVTQDQEGCPSVNILKELFHAAVLRLGDRSFTCFIDALDECDEQQIQDIIFFLEELAEDCTEKKLRFQVCFSSRHYTFIDIENGIKLTLEEQTGHTEDLGSYLEAHLKIGNSALVKELKPQIIEKARGVFLWVVLVVPILNKENRRGRMALRKKLTEVPSGLSDLFRDILQRDQENMEEFLLSVCWILFAWRPLNPAEYYHALWAGLSRQNLADPEFPTMDEEDANDCFIKYVISSSKGLAEVVENDVTYARVQFVHESVRDFLIKDGGFLQIWPDAGPGWDFYGHEQLKLCCEAYITPELVAKAAHDETTAADFLEVDEKYPFLQYASQYVFFHADAASDGVHQEKFLRNFDLRSWILAPQPFRARADGPKFDILYVLANQGYAKLIRNLLANLPGIDMRADGEKLRYPLTVAVAKGDNQSVKALLGLPGDFCDGFDDNDLSNIQIEGLAVYQTAFSWACGEGYLNLAKFLLEKGSSVFGSDSAATRSLILQGSSEDGEKGSALIGAAKNGNIDTVQLLLHEGAEMETRDNDGRTALSQAAMYGRNDLIRFLLKEGAVMETKDNEGQTPLSWAAVRRQVDSARLLLQEGAEIETKNHDGQTPLTLAVMRNEVAVAQLLLSEGADIETKDNEGRTPLLCAVTMRQFPVFHLLLQKGAEIEASDNGGHTPLSRAVMMNLDNLARHLLLEGAKIEARDKNGRTPLAWAAILDRVESTRLLLRAGADVEAKDAKGQTPLSLADTRPHAKNGVYVAQLLLQNGANIETRDDEGRTPLSCAVENDRIPVIEILLKHGAVVNTRDNRGQTPLAKAIARESKAIVQLLNDRGATI